MSFAGLVAAALDASGWEMVPAIDPMIALAVALIVLGMSVREWRARRMRVLALLLSVRLLAVCGLAMILAGPSERVVPDAPLKPLVTLLVDHSRSMSLPDDETGCSRLESARRSWLNDPMLRRLSERAEVVAVAVAEEATMAPLSDLQGLEADGARSRLAAGLDRALSRPWRARFALTRPMHLVLFSDGIDTEGGSLREKAGSARGTRVHAVIPGEGTRGGTFSVDAWFDQGWALRDEPAVLHVEVASGGREHPGLRLVIREGDGEGEVVAERPLTPGRRERFDLPFVPRVAVAPGGVTAARFVASIQSAAAMPGAPPEEVGESLASDSAFIQVAGRRMRVLVIEAEPSWDTRFFVDALAAEPDIEITTVFGLSGAEQAATRLRTTRIIPGPEGSIRRVGGPAPLTQAELERFDVIVFGKGAERILPEGAAASLTRMLELRGGGLLWLRGIRDAEHAADWRVLSPAQSAGELRRIRSTGVRIEGPRAEDAVVLGGITEYVLSTPVMKPASDVLWWGSADGINDEPLAAEIAVGAGRVAAVFAEGLWRAVTKDERGIESARQLWAGLVRRLAYGDGLPPGAAGSLTLLRTEASPGERVGVIVRTRRSDTDLSGRRVVLISPDGSRSESMLSREGEPGSGRWSASVRGEREGDYTVRLSIPGDDPDSEPAMLESRFSVRTRDIELWESAPRRGELTALAEATGGRIWRPSPADAASFIDLLERETISRQGPERIEPVWDRPWVFAGILLLLCVEWWGRRKRGLQ